MTIYMITARKRIVLINKQTEQHPITDVALFVISLKYIHKNS
ncbi:hypothetical protein V070_01422 [Staphylococcus aureus C0673]|nr:hypothetical protein V070_01422 [Staphylococcus aureus C0673]